MSFIKKYKDYHILLEKLKFSEVRNLLKVWKDSNGDKRYDEWFQGKHRIYIPFQSIITPIQTQVIKYLSSIGYQVVNYADGIAFDPKNPKQQPKISKILNRFNPSLKPKYDSDREKAKKSEGNYQIVISRHAYDLANMTSDRSWEHASCMEYRGGSNNRYITCDVKEGTLIAYLINKNDKNIDKPIARVLIKPFINKDNDKDIILWVEEKIYGEQVNGFKESVEIWLKEKQPNISGKFELHPELYNDSGIIRNFYEWSKEYDSVSKLTGYDKYYIVYKDGKCGIVSDKNINLVPIEYDMITICAGVNILLIVVKNGKFGILKNFIPSLKCKYDDITHIDNTSLFILKLNKKFGFINLSYDDVDTVIVEPIYDNIFKSVISNFFIFKIDNKYGLLSSNTGNIVIQPIYDNIDNNLSFRKGNKVGVLDTSNGTEKINFDSNLIDKVVSSIDNIFFICEKNGKKGLLFKNGDILINFLYKSIKKIFVRKGIEFLIEDEKNKIGLYSSPNEKILIPCLYDNIRYIITDNNINFYEIRIGDKVGLYKNDEILVEPKYDAFEIKYSNEGNIYCEAYLNNNRTVIDLSNGKEYDMCITNTYVDHSLGTIYITKNNITNKFGIYDKDYKEIISPIYDSILYYGDINNDLLFKTKINDKQGIITIKNKIILNNIYDDLKKFGNYITCVDNNKCYIYNIENKEISFIGVGTKMYCESEDKLIFNVENGNKYYLYSIKTKNRSKEYDNIYFEYDYLNNNRILLFKIEIDKLKGYMLYDNNNFIEIISPQYLFTYFKDFRNHDYFLICKDIESKITIYDIDGKMLLTNIDSYISEGYDKYIITFNDKTIKTYKVDKNNFIEIPTKQ